MHKLKVVKSFKSAHDAVAWVSASGLDGASVELTSSLKSLGHQGAVPAGNYHVVLKNFKNSTLKSGKGEVVYHPHTGAPVYQYDENGNRSDAGMSSRIAFQAGKGHAAALALQAHESGEAKLTDEQFKEAQRNVNDMHDHYTGSHADAIGSGGEGAKAGFNGMLLDLENSHRETMGHAPASGTTDTSGTAEGAAEPMPKMDASTSVDRETLKSIVEEVVAEVLKSIQEK